MEMITDKLEIEARVLKAANLQMKPLLENQNNIFSDIDGESIIELLTVQKLTCYKQKKTETFHEKYSQTNSNDIYHCHQVFIYYLLCLYPDTMVEEDYYAQMRLFIKYNKK